MIILFWHLISQYYLFQKPSEFNDLTKKLAENTTYSVSRLCPFVYDAGWTLALALNNSQMFLGNKKLEDFSYNDTDMFDAIASGIQSVEFDGMSVSIAPT